MVLNCYESREIIGMVQKVQGPSDIFYNLMFPSANIRVTEPARLKREIKQQLREALAGYGG